MDRDSETRRVRLDSSQLRCLAHPLRSRLLAALRVDGPATSARLARRLDTNTGATSYHLRQLADVGLIEEGPGTGSARQRWWRSAHDLTSWNETDFDDDPYDRASAEWLTARAQQHKLTWVQDWLGTRAEWPVEWRRAASLSDLRLRLTPDGLRQLEAELFAVVERHQRTADNDQPDNDQPDNDQPVNDQPVNDQPVNDQPVNDQAADVMVIIDLFPVREVRL